MTSPENKKSIYLLSAENDKSLINFLMEIGTFRTGGDVESGWRIQKKYNIMTLSEEYCIDTIVDGKYKYIDIIIPDIEKAKSLNIKK